jgi:hypothetical protein
MLPNHRSIPIPNEIKPTVSRQDVVLIGKSTSSALPTDRVPSHPPFLSPLNFNSSLTFLSRGFVCPFDSTRYDADPRACD